MPTDSSYPAPSPGWLHRLASHPLIRIALALLWIAVPFAIVSIAFNVLVSDKMVKRAGALLLAVIVLAAYRTYVNFVEKRTASEISGARAAPELGAGLLLGALLLSMTIGVLAIVGVYQITGVGGWTAMLSTLPGFILAAVLEEVVMRGVVFRILEQWLGSWVALAISAAFFGLVHFLNPGATLIDSGAIMLEAGILLAAAYMLTRRLWLCMGIHLAWNFTQGGIFSAAVSGEATAGLLKSKLVGPAWLTGGAFGVEASLVAVVICLLAGLCLLLVARRKDHVIQASWTLGSRSAPVS